MEPKTPLSKDKLEQVSGGAGIGGGSPDGVILITTANQNGNGGAIYNSGAVSFDGKSFSGETGENRGGAIYNGAGEITSDFAVDPGKNKLR